MDTVIKAVSLFQQGVAYKNLKLGPVAEKALKSSLEISTRMLGEGHPYNAFAVFTLAGLYNDLGSARRPRGLLSALPGEVCRSNPGMGYPRVSYVVSEFAPFLDKRGKRAEALALFEEMMEARRRRVPPGHPMIADGLTIQGPSFSIRPIEGRGPPPRVPGDLRPSPRVPLDPAGRRRNLPGRDPLRPQGLGRGRGPLPDRALSGRHPPPVVLPRPGRGQGGTSASSARCSCTGGSSPRPRRRWNRRCRCYGGTILPTNKSSVYFASTPWPSFDGPRGAPADARDPRPSGGRSARRAAGLALPSSPATSPSASRWSARRTVRAARRSGQLDVLRRGRPRRVPLTPKGLKAEPGFRPLQARQDFRDFVADLAFPVKPFGPLSRSILGRLSTRESSCIHQADQLRRDEPTERCPLPGRTERPA